ncbi:MAG TPA: hypothetical protein VIH99_03945 [Bdellovibrionota bacterium]|jgi:hypothetical protein
MRKFLVLLLLPLLSIAEEGLQVEVNPKVYAPKDFQGKGVKTGKIPPRVRRADRIPDKSNREAAFACVPGLTEDLAKMDELDRDIFYVRAKTKELKELKTLYPSIGEKKLALLQQKLKEK